MDLEEKQFALTSEFMKEFHELEADKEPVIKYYKCGDIFEVSNKDCILAQVEAQKYCLIVCASGNRMVDPILLEHASYEIPLTSVQKLTMYDVIPKEIE